MRKTVITYYDDGSVKDFTEFMDDERHGKSICYYESQFKLNLEKVIASKKMAYFKYENGLLHGLSRAYIKDEESTIKFSAMYDKGQMIYSEEYNKDGTLETKKECTEKTVYKKNP